MTPVSQPTCVITRFEVAHWWQKFTVRRLYRRTSREISAAPGLLSHTLAQAGPRAFFTISVWVHPSAIVGSAAAVHVGAVRFAHKKCRAAWSTQWHLTRISPSAQTWPSSGVDWKSVAAVGAADHGYAAAVTGCSGLPVHGNWFQSQAPDLRSILPTTATPD